MAPGSGSEVYWDLLFGRGLSSMVMGGIFKYGIIIVGSRNDKNSIARKRTYAETVANYVTPRVAPQIDIATHM